MARLNDIKQKLKKMTQEELQAELLSLRKTQFDYRLKKANGTLEKSHVFREVRRTIARVKTLMTEKAGDTHVNS